LHLCIIIIRIEVGNQLQFSIEGKEGVYTNVDPLNFGKIVNYLGKPINDPTAEPQGIKTNIFTTSSKKQERKTIDTQLFTGNIAVDFTKPLAKGNFIVFQGDANTGTEYEYCKKDIAELFLTFEMILVGY